MFEDQKDTQQNLKDPEGKPLASYGAGSQNLSVIIHYPKLNKLITAVYIVTDIMDKDEPIRLKLRTLGLEILSDINSISRTNFSHKVQAILSFLDIALAINLISEMNFNILKKEFFELSSSIKDASQISPTWLEEFLLSSSKTEDKKNSDIGHSTNKGQIQTRIGVQKGSTLMKALSGIKDTNKNNLAPYESEDSRSDFDMLKKQRREDIIKVIKDNGGSATITDIKVKASGSLINCGEKTLQRELVSMIRDGVLNKTGEKRWSRYFLGSRG